MLSDLIRPGEDSRRRGVVASRLSMSPLEPVACVRSTRLVRFMYAHRDHAILEHMLGGFDFSYSNAKLDSVNIHEFAC